MSTDAQKRATSPHASVWVEASAGTGKTKILTDRVLSLLLNGTLPDRILCLTFTKAAAAEMMGRVMEKLALWHTCSADVLHQELADLQGHPATQTQIDLAKKLFHRFMDAPNPMRIQTIHGFCQSLLKRFPLEAGLSPYFKVIDEFESQKLLKNACEKAFEKGADYTIFAQYISPHTFQGLIRDIVSAPHQVKRLLKSHGHFLGASQALANFLDVGFEKSAEQMIANIWGDQIAPRSFFDLVLPILNKEEAGQKLADQLRPFKNFSEKMTEDLFLKYANIFLTKKDEPRKSLVSAKIKKHYPELEDLLLDEANHLVETKEQYKNIRLFEVTHSLLMFVDQVLKEYQHQKNYQNALDYQDLIDYAVGLMENRDKTPWVLYKLDGGIDHILVDEAQDTNPDQWKIIVALVQEFYGNESDTRRTLFVVGDTKQSIYSFQGADPQEFHNVKRDLAERAKTHIHPWEEVSLNTSFRSTKAVLETVDLVFQLESARKGVSINDLQHIPHRSQDGGIVELWPLMKSPESDPEETIGIYETSVQEHVAGAIAKTIQGWLKNGEILESKGRPIMPQDIMILVRKRDTLASHIVRALKFYNIPVSGVDRMVLRNQLVIQDLLALGEFLSLPDDDLTLATVLKGPLIGLEEHALFDLCHTRKGSLWQELKYRKNDKPTFEHAHQFLSDLLNKVDYLTPYGLYIHILNQGENYQKLIATLGLDALDPIQEFLDLALKYEDTNPPSLQGFLSYMTTSNLQVKRNLDQGDINQVRLLTVHGAKGLQAPIVFLPDTTSVPNQRRTLFWQDDLLIWCPSVDLKTNKLRSIQETSESLEMEEYRRLMYVAMTRAEDRLYILGAEPKKGRPMDSWHAMIEDALIPVATPFDMDMGELKGTGLRFKSHQLKEVFYQDTAPLQEFKNLPIPRWAKTPMTSEKSIRFLSPSRPDEGLTVLGTGDIHTLMDPRQRGILIHKLLEKLPKLPDHLWMERGLEFLQINAPALDFEMHEKIVQQVIKTITHPDLAPYFQKSSLAEVPLIGVIEGQHFKGQVDRLAVDHAAKSVYILDYKTGEAIPKTVAGIPNPYIKQMKIYGDLLVAIYPNYKIIKSLLWTENLTLIHL